jgi:hypothetical protein
MTSIIWVIELSLQYLEREVSEREEVSERQIAARTREARWPGT